MPIFNRHSFLLIYYYTLFQYYFVVLQTIFLYKFSAFLHNLSSQKKSWNITVPSHKNSSTFFL